MLHLSASMLYTPRRNSGSNEPPIRKMKAVNAPASHHWGQGTGASGQYRKPVPALQMHARYLAPRGEALLVFVSYVYPYLGTTIHTSPTASSSVTCKSQQPATGNRNPVPHSPPGRCQSEPECNSGPKRGRTCSPRGPSALTRNCWVETSVALQIILISTPAGGTPPGNSAHNCVPVAVPRASRKPKFDVSSGDGGWQPGAPNLGAAEAVEDEVCGDPWATSEAGALVLVEHAASTRIIR